MKFKLFLTFFVIFYLSFFYLSAQKKVESSVFDPLAAVLESIIKTDDSVSMNVLNFVENVYSEHAYYESGAWIPQNSIIKYKPFTGELPDFDFKDFQLPVKGRLTSSYGYRKSFQRFHRGIDIALNLGDTIKCVLPGVVTITGFEKGGYGRYVVVTHAGGIETLYAHLSSCLVNPGYKVKAGETLGIGGTTGNATGPHLHFETRYRGTAINPASWFNIPELFTQ